MLVVVAPSAAAESVAVLEGVLERVRGDLESLWLAIGIRHPLKRIDGFVPSYGQRRAKRPYDSAAWVQQAPKRADN